MAERFEDPCGLLGVGSPAATAPPAESHVAQQIRRDRLRFHQLHDHHYSLPLPTSPADIAPSSSCCGGPKLEHAAGYQVMSHPPAPYYGSYCYAPSVAAFGGQEHQQAPPAFHALQGCHLPGTGYGSVSSSPASGWVVDLGSAAPPPPHLGSLPFSNLSGAPSAAMDLLGFPHHGSGGGCWMGGTSGGEMTLLPGHGCSADATTRSLASVLPPSSSAGGPTCCWHNSFTTGTPPHVLALSLSSSTPPLDLTPVQAVGPIQHHSQLSRQEEGPCTATHAIGYAKYPASGSKQSDDDTDTVSLAMQPDCLRLPPGPLGPFTGYAAILRSSKFLGPAQQLLDDSCSLAKRAPSGFTGIAGCGGDVINTASAGNASPPTDSLVLSSKGTTASPGASSSSPNMSDPCGDVGTRDRDVDPQHQPEIHDKKAKLLFMQAEVSRKYKHYNQQMQMAVSSFESVAGLSSAIPFLSVAVKSVCKHFRFLKHVIADQLNQISRALGEEFVCSSRSGFCDASTPPRLKFLEQTLRKQKAEQKGIAFSETRQPVWRPQRGLPERAVSVLRAWLFDHFLHPYPTDADKIMLASQTGLSRNQVSNWFINARVRVWKPMVEEIHKLETKGLNEVNLNSSDGSSVQADRGELRDMQLQMQDHQQQQQRQEALIPSNCSSTVGLPPEDQRSCHADMWHQDKRSRMEDVYAAGGFGGYGSEMVAGLSAYPGGLDVGSFGAVSLTLGLKQDERPWHPQQYQQLRPYFDSQMVHD